MTGNESERLNALLDLRRYREAERFARECLSRDPESAQGYAGLTRALICLDRPDEALIAAESAVGKDPNSVLAFVLLGWVHGRLGRWAEAEAAADEALRLAPGSESAYTLKARCLSARGRPEAALEVAVRGLAVAPGSVQLTLRKGSAELELNRPADARRTARAGLRNHPNSADLHNLLGKAFSKLAEGAKKGARRSLHLAARRHLFQAVRLNPSNADYQGDWRTEDVSSRWIFVTTVCLVANLFVVPFLADLVGVPVRAGAWWVVVIVTWIVQLVFLAVASVRVSVAFTSLPLDCLYIPSHAMPVRERVRGWGLLAVILVLALVGPTLVALGGVWLWRLV